MAEIIGPEIDGLGGGDSGGGGTGTGGGTPLPPENQTHQFELLQAALGNPVPLAYGRHIVGGNVIFQHEIKTEGKVVIGVALGEGQWDGVEKLWVNGLEINLTDTTKFHFHPGKDGESGTETDPSTPNQKICSFWPGEITDQFTFSRTAYIMLKLDRDPEAPGPEYDIRGIYRTRKVRIFDSSGNQTAFQYSTNPAWQILDVLITRWLKPRALVGAELTAGEKARIDFATFVNAAADCDYDIGGGVKRFEGHIAFVQETDTMRALDQMLLLCRGYLIERLGQWALYIDKERAPAVTVGRDDLARDSLTFLRKTTRDLANLYIFRFRALDSGAGDASKDFQAQMKELADEAHQDAIGRIVKAEIDLGNQTAERAERLIKWLKGRTMLLRQLRCRLLPGSAAIDLLPGDLLTAPDDLDYETTRSWEILEITDNPDGSRDLFAQEYDSSIFSDVAGAQQPAVSTTPGAELTPYEESPTPLGQTQLENGGFDDADPVDVAIGWRLAKRDNAAFAAVRDTADANSEAALKITLPASTSIPGSTTQEIRLSQRKRLRLTELDRLFAETDHKSTIPSMPSGLTVTYRLSAECFDKTGASLGLMDILSLSAAEANWTRLPKGGGAPQPRVKDTTAFVQFCLRVVVVNANPTATSLPASDTILRFDNALAGVVWEPLGMTRTAVYSARRLLMQNNATSPNTKIDVEFSELVVQDKAGSGKRISMKRGDAPLVADITTSGAGGLEPTEAGAGTISSSGTAVTGSGTEFTKFFEVGDYIKLTSGAQAGEFRRITGISSDTALTIASGFSVDQSGVNYGRGGVEVTSEWHYVWLIWGPSVVPKALVSNSPSFPNLSANYTHAGYCGAVYNDSSANFRAIKKCGPRSFNNVALGVKVLSGGTAATLTAIDLKSAVPRTAGLIYGTVAGGGTTNFIVLLSHTSSFAQKELCGLFQNLADPLGTLEFSLFLETEQTMYYDQEQGSGIHVRITGFEEETRVKAGMLTEAPPPPTGGTGGGSGGGETGDPDRVVA